MATTVDGIAIRLGMDPSSLQQGIRRAETSIDSFGSRSRAVIGRMGTAIKGSADRMLTPMTAALTGGGMALAVNQINGVQFAMAQLGNQAHWSDEKIASVTGQVYASAKKSGQSLEDLIAGMTKFVDATGDGEAAVSLLGDTAMTSTAVSARFEDMGAIAAQLGQKFGIAKEDLGSWFEILSTQGDKGAFTLADLADNGERLFASAASGGTVQGGLRSFGALIQIARGTVGSSAEATTVIENMFNTFKQKAKEIKKFTGFNVFDTNGNLKDAETILKTIYKYTGGSSQKLSKFGFTDGALKMMEEFSRQRKVTGDYGFLEDLKNVAPEASKMNNVHEKFGRIIQTNTMQMKIAKTNFQELLAVNLAGPIEKAANALKYLNDHQKIAEAGFKALAVAAIALTAVKIGSWGIEVFRFGKELTSLAKGKGGASAGKGVEGALDSIGVQKVFVTNMGSGGLPGSDYYDDIPGGSRGSKAPVETAKKAEGWFAKKMPTFASWGSKFFGFFKGNFLSIAGVAAPFITGIGGIGTALAAGAVMFAPLIIALAALGAAAALAVGFIELLSARADTMRGIEKSQAANTATIRTKYGAKAEGISGQMDDIEKQLAKENSAFWTNDGKVAELNKRRGELSAQLQDAVRQNKEDMISGKPKILKDALSGGNDKTPPIYQGFQIFVDTEKKTSVIEQTSGTQTKGSVNASTIPWSGRSYQ